MQREHVTIIDIVCAPNPPHLYQNIKQDSAKSESLDLCSSCFRSVMREPPGANEPVRQSGLRVAWSIRGLQVFVELCMIIHQNNESVCACVCLLSGKQPLVRRED